MDNRSDVHDFLVSRRTKVTPEQVGLHAGTNRRVPGLRRAEVAMLANVSVDYYARLQRGGLTGASEVVLDAIAGALQLDDAETAHLHDLARFNFLDREHSERFYRNWKGFADICVEILRTEAGRKPHDKGLQDLIGELSTLSAEFRTRWAKHEVRLHATGVKQFHHPVVGDLDLIYEEMELVADPGSRLLIYSAPSGSPSADALAVLASWAATQDQHDQTSRPATKPTGP